MYFLLHKYLTVCCVYFYHAYWRAGDQILWGLTDDDTHYTQGNCTTANKMVEFRKDAILNDWTAIKRRVALTQKNAQFRENNIDVKSHSLNTLWES